MTQEIYVDSFKPGYIQISVHLPYVQEVGLPERTVHPAADEDVAAVGVCCTVFQECPCFRVSKFKVKVGHYIQKSLHLASMVLNKVGGT